MLSDELDSIGAALGRLLDKVDTETADVLRRCQENLDEAASQAEQLEDNCILNMEEV